MIEWDTIILVFGKSRDVAVAARQQGVPPPDDVTIGPNGEVSFEWQEDDLTTRCTVWEDGKAEEFRFKGTELVKREVI